MSSTTSCAGKLIAVAVLISILSAVCGQCPGNCHCSRYKTFCSLARLNNLPKGLFDTTQLLKIELDNITRIDTTVNLSNLIHLQLMNVNLQKIRPGSFQNMSLLEYLEISYNNITTLKTDSFKYLENLNFLNLTRNEINHLERGTFSGLTNLRILDLSNNAIKLLKANSFEGMRYNAIGTVLPNDKFFGSNLIEPMAFKYISRLTYFTALGDDQFPDLYYYDLSHISFGLRIYYSHIDYINRNNRAMSELSYLHITGQILYDLKDVEFRNLSKLTHLDLSLNRIWEIGSGDFEGLVCLKTLIIKSNLLECIYNRTFRGLYSLETLDISHCKVSTIERDAFEGLSKLRILDLSFNKIHTLEKYTFPTLSKIKELKLEGSIIEHIDVRVFSVMKYLKTLSNAKYTLTFRSIFNFIKPFEDFFKNSAYKCPRLNIVNQEELLNLQRIDNFDLFAHIIIPQNIQVLKSLHLYVDAGYVNPQNQMRHVFETVRFVKDLNVALLNVNSTQILPTFNEFHISQLHILCSNLRSLNDKSLNGLSRVEYLAFYDADNIKIQEGAFRDMNGLRQLTFYFKSNLSYTQGSFLGLQNLRFLSIDKILPYFLPRKMSATNEETTESLDRGVFLGLHNLNKLYLRNNGIRRVKPGAFQGLNKIINIKLDNNAIEKIDAGVFGALCKDDFQISCKNVTLPEYCNSTNALKTLEYLNLDQNNISYIHPHAFISCTNLRRISLSWNAFLTLDIPFLYTPGLKELKMHNCSIVNIPTSAFTCAPLLSQIDLSNNKAMSKLTPSTFLLLKHLKIINLSNSPISCDCNFYETWIWMRQHRVQYKIKCNKSEVRDPYISNKYAEILFSNLICNGTMNNISVPLNRTTDLNDFAFFKQYIEPILLIIIFIFGLLSNGFLLFVSFRHSGMRTKQNACIIHLAAVDVLSLVLNLPLSYWDVVNIRWEFDETLCKIFIFSKDIIVGANSFSIVALSIERYLVARNFSNLKKICKSETQPTAWLLFMTWTSAIITSLPAYFSAVVEIRCLYCPPGNQDYIRNVWTFQLIMYCILPALAIIFLNIKTSFFLRESIRKIPGEIKDNIRAKNRRTVANIVLILVLVFLFSYVPNYILRVLVAWSLVNMEDVFLPSFFTYCLFFFNTVFNPISIFIMSTKFKSYVLRYFPFLKNVRDSESAHVIANRNLWSYKDFRKK